MNTAEATHAADAAHAPTGVIGAHTFSEVKPEARGAFAKAFLTAPRQLGTCFCSSKGLCREMVRHLHLKGAKTVFELGSGTGPLTFEVLRRIEPGCRFFAVEMNPGLAARLRDRFPGVAVLEADAIELTKLCHAHDIVPGTVDAVCASLPYMLLPRVLQDRALSEIHAALKPGGRMVMLTYWPEEFHPKARQWRRLLDERFRVVKRAAFVWTNVPPAWVYWAEK